MSRANIFLKAALGASVLLAGCATTQQQKPEPTAETKTTAEQPQAQTTKPATPEQPAQPSSLNATEIPARPLNRPEPMQLVVLKDPNKPIITFRLAFKTGSIDDPKGKEGLTALTSHLMAEGGTKALSSAELLDALFPMAAELNVSTDKEMTAFVGRVHQDNLDAFLKIFGDVLLEPRFDEKEFERIRTQLVNEVQNELRGQNDEELGKVALDAMIFEGTPYAHFSDGTVQGLKSLTLDDVKNHWKNVFTQDRLVIGLGGNVTDALKQKVLARFGELPKTGAPAVEMPAVAVQKGRTWIFQKPVLSTAISMGYAYNVRRGDKDFFPLAAAMSYLGEHRQFNGVLFNQLREKRGLNYGNYAYPEHFVQEGWGTFATTNIPRATQDFSIWIRPVESQNTMFATRGAIYFLDKLINEGIPEDQFELTKGFLLGYTRLWEQTDSRRLGYAIDALFYGTPNYLESYRAALQKMTAKDVNDAVKRNLSADRLNYVYVAPDAAALKKLLVEQPATPMNYPTPKPPEVLEVDKAIAVQKIPLDPKKIEIKDVSQFMEK